MKTTRRNFLLGAGLCSSAIAFGATPLFALEKTPAAPTLKGSVYALGLGASKLPGYQDKKAQYSVLTSINLEDGNLKQSVLEMGEGHSAIGVGDGRILCVSHHKPVCMMVDKNHKTLATFNSVDGYLYGGHAQVFKERNQFIISLRYDHAKTTADTGKFEVYDLNTLKRIDVVDSEGIQPHEIHRIPNTNELAVTQYGDVDVDALPLEFNVLDTKLTILDATTLKPKRHYKQSDFNAMLTHMRVDKDGWAYCVLTQYIKYIDEKVATHLKLDPEKIALSQLEKIFGQKWDFPVPKESTLERHLPVSLPFVRINTQTGEKQIIDTGLKNHLRSQSVAYNAATGTAIALYHHSDNLVLHQVGKDAEVLQHDKLKLSRIRGVTDIPGTSCIGVCGTYDDVSIFDLTSREVIAHYTTKTFESTHLYHEDEV